MFTVFERLLHSEAFTDVTLACDGGSLKCHKIVLAASSDYFQKLFIDNSSEHPIVFLKVRDSYSHVKNQIFKYSISAGCEGQPGAGAAGLHVQGRGLRVPG